mmetsp:Transcript_6792/g.11942  ORF Transcript_6792/g.11942 Transcript_6792/m.11942 type:complete len:98 (-) Transcript_6792:63-356(-)
MCSISHQHGCSWMGYFPSLALPTWLDTGSAPRTQSSEQETWEAGRKGERSDLSLVGWGFDRLATAGSHSSMSAPEKAGPWICAIQKTWHSPSDAVFR